MNDSNKNFKLSWAAIFCAIVSIFIVPIFFGFLGASLATYELYNKAGNKLAAIAILANIVCMIMGILFGFMLTGQGASGLITYTIA